jgi:hypothetical protein
MSRSCFLDESPVLASVPPTSESPGGLTGTHLELPFSALTVRHRCTGKDRRDVFGVPMTAQRALSSVQFT